MNCNYKQPKSQNIVRLSPLLFHEYQGREKESLEGTDEQQTIHCENEYTAFILNISQKYLQLCHSFHQVEVKYLAIEICIIQRLLIRLHTRPGMAPICSWPGYRAQGLDTQSRYDCRWGRSFHKYLRLYQSTMDGGLQMFRL